MFGLWFGTIAVAQPSAILNKKVTLRPQQATLEKLLNELSTVAGFKISLNNELTTSNTTINLRLSGEHTVQQYLDAIVKELDIEYIEFKGMLIVRPKDVANQIAKPKKDREPKSRNTTKQIQRQDSLELIVGIGTKELALSDYQASSSQLILFVNQLERLVTVGYSKLRKKEILGSVSSIDASQIEISPVLNIEQTLQGQTSGVQIVNSSGSPGKEAMIRIRGNSSIQALNSPLYIVDGVPTLSGALLNSFLWVSGGQHISFLSFINPQDIASVEILKDAASASIYGSRGGNGLVLITTKKGSSHDKFSLNFDTYQGVQAKPQQYSLMNAREYSDYASRAYANAGESDIKTPLYTGYNTNWQDEILQTGWIHNYQLSLSGGDSMTHYYISGRWLEQSGTIIETGLENKNIRLNMDQKIGKKIKIGINLNGNNTINRTIFEGFNAYSVYQNALLRNPNLPVYDANGNYSIDPMGVENPVQAAREAGIDINQLRLTGNLFAEWQIFKHLSLRSSVAADIFNIEEQMDISGNFQANKGTTIGNTANEQEYLQMTDHVLTYQTKTHQHDIQILGGVAFQKSNIDRNIIYRSFNQTENTSEYNEDAANLWTNIDSYFGQLNYAWLNKYLCSFSARTDGTTRFGNEIRYGFFPSASVGWRISEERFMKQLPFVNDLKIRAGYGSTGNQEGIFQYNSKGLPVNHQLPPSIVAQLPDLNLIWEEVKQSDIGLDITLLDNRLSVTGDVFLKTSKNILGNQYKTIDGNKYMVLENVGEIENRGIDLMLQTLNFTGNFKWNTTVNISWIQNQVIAYNVDKGNEDIERMDDYPMKITSANLPDNYYGSFYGYIYQGVNSATGEAIFQDLNNDGFINEKDETIIGRSVPKNFGSIINTLSFKGFELNILMQWSYGNQVYNQTRAVLESPYYADKYNVSTQVADAWEKPSDQTAIAKPLLTAQSTDYRIMSSKFVEDGSYLKIRSITLNYYFPENICSKIKLKQLKTYLSVNNIYTFTHYSGLDPEAQNRYARNTMLGVDVFNYPTSSSFIFGVSLGL